MKLVEKKLHKNTKNYSF